MTYHNINLHNKFSSVDKPVILWNLTNQCNLYCNYCYQNAGKKGKELPLKKKLELIDQFASSGVWKIAFSGGEPLLSPDLYKLLEYSKKTKIITSIYTNGTLLTKKNVKKLYDCGIDYVNISLDSNIPEIHNSFRKGKRNFLEKALEGIYSVIEKGINTKIFATISKKNLNNLEDLIIFSKSLNVQQLELIVLYPIGRGKNLREELLDRKDNKKLLEIVAKHSLYNPNFIFLNDPQYHLFFLDYLKKIEKENLIKEINSTGCCAGVSSCAIQPDGKITPCVLTPNLEVGDLEKKSFEKIWKNSAILRQLRDRNNLKGICGECKDKDYCGGCRSRALSYTGDFFSGDPLCITDTVSPIKNSSL